MRALLKYLAASLLPVAFLAGAGAAEARVLIDREAGVKFDVPFHVARALRGEAIEAVLKRQLGHLPEGVRYTSAAYGEGNATFVLVWTRPAPGGVSRQLADRLAEGGSGGFVFDKETLRGESTLPDQGGYHVRLLLQLVKDRFTYVGYYYKTPQQLAGFEHLKRTLKVGRLSRLYYLSLPATPGRSWGRLIMEALAALGVLSLVGAGAAYAYRWMGREGGDSLADGAAASRGEPLAGIAPGGGGSAIPAHEGPRV